MIVEVEMLRTNWIFRDREVGDTKDLKKFINALADTDSDEMYTTDFMIMVVNEFWSLYQVAIIVACFLPYLFVFFPVTIYYFTFIMGEEEEKLDKVGPEIEAVLGISVIVCTLYFFSFEIF